MFLPICKFVSFLFVALFSDGEYDVPELQQVWRDQNSLPDFAEVLLSPLGVVAGNKLLVDGVFELVPCISNIPGRHDVEPPYRRGPY